jgi:hypothetical protein
MANRLGAGGVTNVITISELRDDVTGQYLESATVIVDVLDSTGAPVTGATGLAATKVSGTSGSKTLYRAIIPSTVVLLAGTYTVNATATDAVGVGKFPRSVPCD